MSTTVAAPQKIQPQSPALFRRLHDARRLLIGRTWYRLDELPIARREAVEIQQLAREATYHAVEILGCPSLISVPAFKDGPAVLVHKGLPDADEAPWRIDAATWSTWKDAGYITYL